MILQRILAIGMLGGSLVLAGCEAAAYVAQGLVPDPKVKAAYELDPRTTLILVDDPLHLLPGQDHRSLMAGWIGDDIAKQTDLESDIFVEAARVDGVRASEPEFNRWPIDKVGRELGADQVIYVHVEAYHLNSANDMYSPSGKLRVKVIDSRSGKRLFPKHNESGYAVRGRLAFDTREQPDPGRRLELSRNLTFALSTQVARIFYDFQPPSTPFADKK